MYDNWISRCSLYRSIFHFSEDCKVWISFCSQMNLCLWAIVTSLFNSLPVKFMLVNNCNRLLNWFTLSLCMILVNCFLTSLEYAFAILLHAPLSFECPNRGIIQLPHSCFHMSIDVFIHMSSYAIVGDMLSILRNIRTFIHRWHMLVCGVLIYCAYSSMPLLKLDELCIDINVWLV